MTCCGTTSYGNGPTIYRRYISRDERIAWLNEYAQALENELNGVKERIAELAE